MREKLLLIIFILILIINVFPLISNASSDYLYLNNLDFYVQINSDGSINVTEIWDIDIEQTNTLFKTFKTDEEKYSSITDVKVTDITDNENHRFTKINTYMYHVTENCYYGLINDDGDFEIAWGVGLDNDEDTRKYKIEYKVNDAISKYKDYSELYWQFIGNNFEIDAKKVKGAIILPSKVKNKEEIKVWAHSKDLNGTIYATDLNKVEFEMDNYRGGRYVEVRILFPTEMISATERIYNSNILEKAVAEETKWADEANRQREFNKQVSKTIFIGIVIITIIATIFFGKKISKYRNILKGLNKLKPTNKLDYYREMPNENATPGEAVFLLKGLYNDFSVDFGKIFSATLLNLTLKKYVSLEIDNNKKGKESIKIRIINKGNKPLKKDENEIFRFLSVIMKSNDEITIKELEKYIEKHPTDIEREIKSVHESVKTNIIQDGYFDKEQYKKYEEYLGYMVLYIVGAAFSILLLPLSAVFIINAVYCGKIINKINILTQTGLDQKEMWKGLKKYMEEFSLLNEKDVPALVVWEQYLVYATAFGISDKVLKQLKIVYPDVDQLNGVNTSTYMYFMYHSNFNTNFSNAINSSIASATYSSGSGSGGGFSGGGGFGGGGRRRRRKIKFSFKKY